MRLLPLTAFVVVVAGCPAKVATVEVTPPKVELRADSQSQVLMATPKDAEGMAIEGERPVTWKSGDPAVATVDSGGKVKPAGSGATTITATIEEQSASIPVTVVLLKRIQLQSPAMVIVAGVPSEAIALNFMNERGEVIDANGLKAKWKTADPAIANVNEAGVVTGVAAGSTLLTAEVKDLKAEMTVTVNPPPEPPPPETPPAPEPGKKPKPK
ncbi:MAG: Ig-like domain-containing protein [Deltaproteobacteria bacterium]|nr:Ig-like domain-containing protein [Deltaproteobacteria bacterium]